MTRLLFLISLTLVSTSLSLANESTSPEDCQNHLVPAVEPRIMQLAQLLKAGNHQGYWTSIPPEMKLNHSEAKKLIEKTTSPGFKVQLLRTFPGAVENAKSEILAISRERLNQFIESEKKEETEELSEPYLLGMLQAYGTSEDLLLVNKTEERFGQVTAHLARWTTEYISAREEVRDRKSFRIQEASFILEKFKEAAEKDNAVEVLTALQLYYRYMVPEDITWVARYLLEKKKYDHATIALGYATLPMNAISPAEVAPLLEGIRAKIDLDPKNLDEIPLSLADLKLLADYGDSMDAVTLSSLAEVYKEAAQKTALEPQKGRFLERYNQLMSAAHQIHIRLAP